jgi:hypothetical protein
MQDFAQLSVGNLDHLNNDRSSTSESCSCVYMVSQRFGCPIVHWMHLLLLLALN